MRTLYQAGKLQQVLREMANYKVEILCVSEARLTDSGRRILASGHTIFYSGSHCDEEGRENFTRMETSKRSIDENEIQLKVCNVDNNRMLRANGRSIGRRKGRIL